MRSSETYSEHCPLLAGQAVIDSVEGDEEPCWASPPPGSKKSSYRSTWTPRCLRRTAADRCRRKLRPPRSCSRPGRVQGSFAGSLRKRSGHVAHHRLFTLNLRREERAKLTAGLHRAARARGAGLGASCQWV